MIMVNEATLEASICEDSFYEFLQRFWSTIIPEKPVWNWHIKYICDELQTMAERVFKRLPKEHDLIINVSPGSTKSTICSVMFPVWCWIRDPRIRTICGSYAHALSLHLSTQSRNIVQSDKFVRLFGNIELDETQKGLLTNTDRGQRVATSTGGAITGMHGHFIIIDDPINPKEADSKVMIEGANTWIDRTLMTRKVDKEITPVILIMQRLHQNDPTGHMLNKPREKYPIKHICLPAIRTPDVKPRTLRKFYKDGLMDPIRLSKKVIGAAGVELGQYGYAGQFLQSPAPPEGGMFKTEKIQIGVPPYRMVKLVRYWDKAGTADGGAFSVGILMGIDKVGRFWVMDVVRGQWEAYEREQVILRTAQMDGKKVLIAVEQEGGSGGKESAQATLRRLAGYRVQLDIPRGDKVKRADPYSYQVNGGNVYMVAGPWNKLYLEELQYFPKSTFKDQVDGSSGAFAMLTKHRKRVGGYR